MYNLVVFINKSRGVFMQDNEKDLLEVPEENSQVNENEQKSQEKELSTENQQDGYEVKLENNDNWKFDAEAPMIDDNLFVDNEKFVIDKNDFKKQVRETEKAKEKYKAKSDSVDNDNQIVINKDSLKIIPVAVVTILVLIALVVLGVRYYTVPNNKEGELMNPPAVAATIDGTNVSIGMYNYYYSSVVSYYEQYAAYGYFDLDTSKSYDKQFTTDSEGNQITWADFFKNEALREIKLNLVYYTKGLEEGITLTKAQQDVIDEQIESMKASASDSSVSLDQYISENFGEFCSESTVRLMLEQYYVAMNYKGQFSIDYKPSEEEIDSYYDEHKNDYYQISFSYIATEYDSTDDESKKESQAVIDEYMEKITDRNSIIALVPTVYADYIQTDTESAMANDSTLTEDEAREQAIATYEQNIDATITGAESPFGDKITQWLFSDDTKVGSKNYYIDEESGYAYVILKTENAELDESDTYSVRHILICPESDEETTDTSEEVTYTDEQWKEAENTANEILEKFNSGDKSEYSFAVLAEENSEDTASTSSGSNGLFGGLYEGVTKGEMVSEFENWALDSSREYGDTGIVKSEYGYHIMYFVSIAPKYKVQLISDIKSEQLNELMDNSEVNLHDSTVNKAIEKYNDAKAEEASQDESSADTSSDTVVD